MVKQFRKKPVVIDAVQWTGKNTGLVAEFVGGKVDKYLDGLHIATLEDSDKAKHFASIGDWIIKGIQGEFYPCKPDIFEQTYEEV